MIPPLDSITAEPELRGRTLLIIDDDPNNLAVLMDHLEEASFKTLVAEDGESGLERAAYAQPDLILLDILMPGMDGIETCRRLKERASTKDIPVIFMTALAEMKHKVRGFEAGGVDYITKPFQREEVLARVITHLRIRELTSRLREANATLEMRVSERTAELARANKELQAEIVERKRTEELLRKINRAYRALTNCNQALLHATDEKELLQEICRIIVRDCGYKLVWIGYAEHDDARTVRPVAQSGYEEGYLDSIRVSWADNEFGSSPSGTAIRTKKPVINRDLPTSPDFAPWRKEAIKRGYASSASLPMLSGEGEVIGALNVYAAQPDAFTPEEKDLLVELTADLTYGITSMRNLARKRQTEYALIESENKFKSFAEQAIVGIYLIQDGIFKYANPRFAEMFGYSTEQILTDLHLETLFLPEDIPLVNEQVRKRLAGEISFSHYEVRGLKKDGKVVNLEVFGSTMTYNNRPAAIGTVLDITEHKKTAEQLMHSQKMEAIGRLAGGIAHDFNNLLTVIMGFGNLLKIQLDIKNPLHSHADQIIGASERAAQLTKSLLAFSRKQVMSLELVDLNEIVRRFDKLLRRIIGEDIELKTELPTEKLMVMADSGQLEQVIMNLAVNGRDAMPKGGKLTITTGRVHLDREITCQYDHISPGNYAAISIADTGKGMDEITKERAFEPFFTTKESGKGTGLGLSIVFGIVKQHNGVIDVKSEPGQGATFTIYLELVEQQPAKSEPAAPSFPVGGKETILVAEDDKDVRKFIRAMLQEYGYSVIEAADGNEAILRFQEHSDIIQLVFLDVVMPKKNGKEVYAEIKKVKRDVPVLFSSGYPAEILYEKGLLEKGVRFILKPVSPIVLLKNVREAISGKEFKNDL